MDNYFEHLKIAPKKAHIHVTDKSKRDCVCRLYMSQDPITSIPFFNLISIDSDDSKDPEVLEKLGKLIDESPVISGEYMCIYTLVENDLNERRLPSIVSFDAETLNNSYFKNPHFFDGNRNVYTEIGSPIAFRFEDGLFKLENGSSLNPDELQKQYVFCDSSNQQIVFTNQTLPKIAEEFSNLSVNAKNDGINLLKEIRKTFKKEIFIAPQTQMEITLLDAILENYNEHFNDVEILEEIEIEDSVWENVSDSVNGVLNLPSGLDYNSLPTLGAAKDMMISGLGENIWSMAKKIFKSITPVIIDNVRTISAPNSYNSPFESYVTNLELVGIKKQISTETYSHINKIYNPDDVQLYELGDMEILYVKDQYQESLYFFPSREYLNSDYDIDNDSGLRF